MDFFQSVMDTIENRMSKMEDRIDINSKLIQID